VNRSGELSGAVIEGEGFSLGVRFGPEGRVEEFPIMLNGVMAQAGVSYSRGSEILGISLTFTPMGAEEESAEPAKFEVLEYMDSYPSMVRCSRGDAWYFISLSRGGDGIIETWYDEEGKYIGAYGYTFGKIGNDSRIRFCRDYSNPEGVTEYHYDSRLLVTESLGPGGVYKVLFYRDDLPRYWEYRPNGETGGKYTLQWDEQGLLLQITGDGEIYRRYEYTLDGKGNWIERQEFRMTRQSELWVPVPGAAIRRVLEYRE
jgi:hypothetical protein